MLPPHFDDSQLSIALAREVRARVLPMTGGVAPYSNEVVSLTLDWVQAKSFGDEVAKKMFVCWANCPSSHMRISVSFLNLEAN